MNAVVVDRVVLGFVLNTCRFGHRLLLAVTNVQVILHKTFYNPGVSSILVKTR